MMNDITKPSDNAMVIQKEYKMNSLFPKMYTSGLFEIGLVLSGTGTLKVLDSEMPCKSGDVFVIRPDCPHYLCPSEPDEILTVKHLFFNVEDYFEGTIIQKESKNYCYGIFADNSYMAYAVLTPSAQSEIAGFMDMIEHESAERRSQWERVVGAYLSMILITIERYVGKAIKNFPAVFSKEWNIIAQVIRIINEHFGENDLTLAKIADGLYISQSHISKMFKQCIGENFGDYLRKIRVNHACKLLENTELTVKEIATLCGKKDLQSFYNTFFELKGVTPTQYRTQNNKKIGGGPLMSIFIEISENLQKGRARNVKELVQQAIDQGSNPEDILTKALIPGMTVVGEKFRNNEVFVPEVLVAARAMNMGAQVLKPYLVESGVKAIGKVCIGTVKGDLHDIGKNLVKMMLEGRGLEVIDLGIDVPPEKFVQTAKEEESGKIKLKVNGRLLKPDVEPIMVNDRVMVTVRTIFEALETNLTFDETTLTATGERDGLVVKITDNSKTAYVNSKPVELDSPAIIVNGRFLVPARFISESMGAEVNWNELRKTVIIEGGICVYKPIHGLDGELGVYRAIQSGDDGAGHSIPNLFDGTKESWSVAADNPNGSYGIFDFGSVRQLRNMHLSFYAGTQRIYTFELFVSDDGVNYTPIERKYSSSGKTDEMEVFPINAQGRFLKLVGHGNNLNTWNNFTEIAFTGR